MKLSVSVTNYSWPQTEVGPQLVSLARFLDQTAVDTLWVADHLMQADPTSRPDEAMLEAYTVEKRTLRLVAKYADACNLYDIPGGGPMIQHQLDVLARHCADVGRPEQEVERTVTTALESGETVGNFVKRCSALDELGLQHVVVITRGRPWSANDLDVVAAAADQLAGLAHTPG